MPPFQWLPGAHRTLRYGRPHGRGRGRRETCRTLRYARHYIGGPASETPTISAGMRAGDYGAPITIRDGPLGAESAEVRLAAAQRSLARLAWRPGTPAACPALGQIRDAGSACAVTAADDAGDGRPGRPRPHTRFAFTRTPAAPGAGQFLPGPVSTADADAQVPGPGGSGPGRPGPDPGGYPRERPAGPGIRHDPRRPAGPASAGWRWRVDDVGCLP